MSAAPDVPSWGSIPTRPRCHACQQVMTVNFVVSDEVWESVVHPQFRNAYLCLSCFASRADEKLIAWDLDIKLYPVSLCTLVKSVRGLGPRDIQRDLSRFNRARGYVPPQPPQSTGTAKPSND